MRSRTILVSALLLLVLGPPLSGGSSRGSLTDKLELWINGTHLRGANIYQRRVYPELDGPDFLGPGPVGPPYTQNDFDRLAALGANYVNISHPGLFTERPPYRLDSNIQGNLDNLLDMIGRAGMFAVISFRTGPGRSEFTFFRDGAGDWFDRSYLNESMWKDRAAQDGWVEMWRSAAARYRSSSIVVGYDLMVEPNANAVLNVWDPATFYGRYSNTLYDWNQLHPRISAAIRSADTQTPVLIGGMSYSSIAWLPYLKPTGDARTVYAAHQYEPFEYTTQRPDATGRLRLTYPGRFDIDGDGVADRFNRAWLQGLLMTVDAFASDHHVPVAVNEFGTMRWEPGAASFMGDQMNLLEERHMNHALWLWESSWGPLAEEDAFNFRHGPNPSNHTDVASSKLMSVIRSYWGRNTIRPSIH